MTTLIRGVHLCTMARQTGFGELLHHAVVLKGGLVAWVGPEGDLPAHIRPDFEFDGEGGWLLPGLIDCHTHLVYAGNRADEFEQRLAGATYSEIAEAGGGILATVKATRGATEQELAACAQPRLDALAREGVTTVEVKSGYGLKTETELRMLQAAGSLTGAHVHRTLLAAHAFPPEYRNDHEAYVDLVCDETIPRAVGRADAVDAFCEGIAFSPDQVRRVFRAARAYGFRVKLHADQLSDLGGAGLAAEFGALSADHVEYASEDSVARMARSGTVAVLLPTAFYNLGESTLPPIPAFRSQRVPMAVATDHNPGSSPCLSLLLALNMACVLFRLSPSEALAGATRVAAQALGIESKAGTIEVHKRADLALYAIDHPRDLCARIGGGPCVRRWLSGDPQPTSG